MERSGEATQGTAIWWPVILCAGVYLVSVAVRMVELGQWSHPGLMVNGEHILATHDSYYWVAAAKGVRTVHNSLLPEFTRLLAGLTGASLGQVAFWVPLFMGSLLGPVTCLWGMLLGGRWAGITAGVLGALAPGVLSRTRFGYYDTDMFTLLMPALAALLLAWLLRDCLRSGWLRHREDGGEGPSWRFVLILAVAAGLTARLSWWWHEDVYRILAALFIGGVVLVAVLGRPGFRVRAFWGLVLFGLFGLVGGVDTAWVAGSLFFKSALALTGGIQAQSQIKDVVLLSNFFWLLLAGALVLAAVLLPARIRDRLANPWLAGSLAGVLALFMLQATFLDVVWIRLMPYLDPAGVEGGAALAAGAARTGPLYPSIIQSIIEAKLVGLGAVLERLGPTTWLSAAGILGFFWVCWKRPLAVLLLPLLLLALAGMKMGIRFTMFGAPAVALGLGVPLAWLTQGIPGRWTARPWAQPVVQVVAGLLLLIPLVARYSALTPTPVVDAPHAEALIKLGEIAPEGSMVWTWWDWGYATQYYSGRTTPVDGGLHAGRDVYPTALALATPSLEQANRIIRWSALQDYDPARVWDGMSGAKVAEFVDGLKRGNVQTPDIEPQYLVVTWANFPIVKWITFFGDWNLAKGEGAGAENQRIRNFQFDPGRGAVVFENGSSVPVSSVDSLEPELTNHKDYWSNSGGPHLVFNKYRGDAFLMSDTAYQSAMVQLLLARPSEVRDQFELVYDGSPHVRVYKVVGSGS